MKISVNWIKQFTDIDLSIEDLVAKIGAQIGAVEEIIDIGARYQGIVVAKVVTCEKHPNADKLSVCLIDDGGVVAGVNRNDSGLVEVVCGAPNVRQDLMVAWIPPGATVPSTYDKEPFVLEARELRGVVSNGMIASGKELAINEDHGGIVELDIEAAPGTPFAEVYELNDYVIDIENKMFTHRPDCFGIIGVAREIAGVQNKQFTSPEWYLRSLDRIKPGKTKLPLNVVNDAPELVPRFMAVAMAEVNVHPSPLIIQTYLARVGIRPINNIVDTTNYLMILTGQPLHAYDYDKVAAKSGEVPTLVARLAKNNEKLTLINGKTYELESPSIVIATDTGAIGVGGVMGGATTEVDENTKNIILECANFDMYSIRKTAMKYGLFTDAVTRFNKGQSPLQNERVIEEAVATLQYVSGADTASEVFDEGTEPKQPKEVEVDYRLINDRLGLELEEKDIIKRLENVEMTVKTEGELLIIQPPYWRTDLEISEDIIEEVGRLVGYDKLPLVLPRRSIKPTERNRTLDFATDVRDKLSSMGANEALTYSFVHGKLLDTVGQDKDKAFKLSNALSPDLQFYRLSLTPSLLEKVHANLRSDYVRDTEDNEFALFEIGKTHIKEVHSQSEPDVPYEFQRIALVIAADDKTAKRKYGGAAYYQAQSYLRELLSAFNIDFSLEPLDPSRYDINTVVEIAPFDPERSATITVNESVIGQVGEFLPKVKKQLKLPHWTAGFELDMRALEEHSRPLSYQAIPRYPKVVQDITLRVSSNVLHAQLLKVLNQTLDVLAGDKLYLNLMPKDVFQKEGEPHSNITLRLWAAHYEKTMTATEVNELLGALAERANQEFGAERV